jgi:hypothetical protein
MPRPILGLVAGGLVVATLLPGRAALAQRGGGAHMSRSVARGSVSASGADFNRGAGMNRDVNRDTGINRNFNSNVNVDRNVNVNRDVNWDRDVDVNVDHRYGGWGYGCCYNAAATAAVATAAAVTTAAVVGSVVHTLPPSCESVSVSGVTYQRCGSTWYQPQFSGSAVTYVVVNPPR